MSNGMTIDALYEAFMDIDEEGIATGETPFAEDIFDFFGKKLRKKGWESGEWAAEYGMYLPTFDPAQIHLAERKRDLDYRKAMHTLETTQDSLDRVYATETDTLSTALGKEMEKGRKIATRTGIRSGGVESAIGDTIATSGSKVKDLGDRLKISETETKDKYNIAMVDTALDFDKTVEDEKEEFYDRTMAAIMRLMETGAFDCPPDDPDCDKLCLEECPQTCDAPLICNRCTGECQIGETPPGWEMHLGPCTEGMEIAGCETHGDSCYCDAEVVANQPVTTEVDAFGCACSQILGGGSLICSDAAGNDCEPDWSTYGTFCDPSIDDCNNPAACCYDSDDDDESYVPGGTSLGGYECTKVVADCSVLCQANPWCDCPADICYSGWPDFSVIDCSQC